MKLVKQIFGMIGRLNPLWWLRLGWFIVSNWWRGRAKIDYVSLTVPADMPPLPEERGFIQRRIFGDPAISLTDLDREFQRLADDPRPKGIILYLRGFEMSLAHLQSLRASIQRLRERGKRVVCYAQGYDMATYYVASAADEIILQPGGVLMTLGLQQQAVFLKETLDMVGVALDVVAVTPYKSAMDTFINSDITPESRAQLEWLLDSRFNIILEGIASGRGLTTEAVRTMIDGAPYVDTDALAKGLVEAACNEEALPGYLNAEHVIPWDKAQRKLLKRWRKPSQKYVALLNVSGMIVQGESRKPPAVPLPIPVPLVGEDMAGDETIVQQVRHLIEDENAAAVILYIDSPGGSSDASEAMASALSELAKTRPVVAYMASVAASGGYYIATPAQWIVAQPGTITGSIGVIMAKLVTGEVFAKVRANRVEFLRGKNAALLGDSTPMTDEQRGLMRRVIERTYEQFVERVAASRSMTFDAVDAIGGGRVWTGAQARENGLVDELGDLKAALKKARELAELDENAPLVLFEGEREKLPPQLAKAAEDANPAAALAYVNQLTRLVFNGRPQMLMPFEIR